MKPDSLLEHINRHEYSSAGKARYPLKRTENLGHR